MDENSPGDDLVDARREAPEMRLEHTAMCCPRRGSSRAQRICNQLDDACCSSYGSGDQSRGLRRQRQYHIHILWIHAHLDENSADALRRPQPATSPRRREANPWQMLSLFRYFDWGADST